MRHVDEIKQLKKKIMDLQRQSAHEIGRRDKKIADQEKQLSRLRDELAQNHRGTVELNRAADALMVQAAVTYGEDAKDDETGEILGKRLNLPLFRVDELLGKYEIRARRDNQAGLYIVGVVPREEATP